MGEYLQADLILEIISRLPSKSVARCRCLSKLWASLLTLGSPYFTELFLTQSKTRPRLLFAIRKNEEEWCLYSSPQPQISFTKAESSISVTAEFHMPLPKCRFLLISPSISGLIYFSRMPNYNSPVLCNPSTRRLFWLPHLIRAYRSFFGYDPINKQFSVLAICYPLPSYRAFPSSYQILKLETGKVSWRTLDCPLHHYPERINICINGILYYIAKFGSNYPDKIACFDLNSEEFKFVDAPWPRDPKILVNFKGQLGGIDTMWVEFSEERYKLELSLWILEDVEKQEWSKQKYLLPLWDTQVVDFSIFGVTTTSEVVISALSITSQLYVSFFNLEGNILRKVEIKVFEGFTLYGYVQGCVDYVEDLKDLNWS